MWLMYATYRPTFVEFSASQSLPFQSRVQDHYLATYQASFIAICTAQFGQKAFKDGVDVRAPPVSPNLDALLVV